MRKLICLATFVGSLASAPASAMTYALVPYQNGPALLADGHIGASEASRLLAAVGQAHALGVRPTTLIISSPGGNLGGALDLGVVVRQLGMRTVVGSLARDASGQLAFGPGGCHSACVMALMAGVQRVVTPGSSVSVHSPQAVVVSGGRAYHLDGELNRHIVARSTPTLRAYARLMGVSPAVIDLANRVPNTTSRRLSSAELAGFRLTGSGPSSKMPARKLKTPRGRA